MPSSSKGGKDLTVFLLSLLIAFSIWLIHNLSLNYTQVVSVPVTARSNIEGHQAVSSNSCEVAARCRMSGFSLFRSRYRSRSRTVEVFFDAADLTSDGGDLFSVPSEALVSYFSSIFGDEARLESFVSRSVQFRFPYENHKKVPVIAVHNISFLPQYVALGPMSVQPDSVVIYGEPYLLESIEGVFTRPIDKEKVRSGVHGVVQLEPIGGVRMSSGEVNYAMEVSRYVEIRAAVRVGTAHVPSGRTLSVYPSQADVVFRCAFPVQVNPEEKARFYIDYADFAGSINGRCVPRAADIPSGVISWRIEPQVFECIERMKR